jgi:hypothetical protein
MEDEVFKLRAIENAIGILQENKNKQNSKELDFVIDILQERKRQVKLEKEEKIGMA